MDLNKGQHMGVKLDGMRQQAYHALEEPRHAEAPSWAKTINWFYKWDQSQPLLVAGRDGWTALCTCQGLIRTQMTGSR